MVTCPKCTHTFAPDDAPVRATEATGYKPGQSRDGHGKWDSHGAPSAPKASAVTKSPAPKSGGAGSVLGDNKGRKYVLTPADKKAVKAAKLSPQLQMEYTARRFRGETHEEALGTVKALAKNKSKPAAEGAANASEAFIDGQLSFSDLSQLVTKALRDRLRANEPDRYSYVFVVDISATDVVYCVEGGDGDLFQRTYSVTGDEVALGDPSAVVRTYAPAATVESDVDDDGAAQVTGGQVVATATESRDRIEGRVVEAKGNDASGNRIFRVRVIAYGDSKNMRRYPESVMRAAAPLYDGAKAYDHHRTEAEMATGTIAGLIGYYRSAEATAEGIEADLHLLPSASQAAEALDASLAAQADGLPPVVGISHDVMATYRAFVEGGIRLQEATSIVTVNSADIVANPAAGGQATRMVAGGTDTNTNNLAGKASAGESTKETDVAPTKEDVLAALKGATPEELSAVGLSKAGTTATETVAPATAPAVQDGELKTSFLGKLLIKQKVLDAGLPESAVESVAEALPDRVTETAVDAQLAALKATLGIVERAGLTPQHTVQVTQESRQKKIDALDAFFAGDYTKGYHSFREAFIDFTGTRPMAFGEDFNRTVLRESFGGAQGGYDSATRSTESMDSTSWNLVLGDSITRRLMAEYSQPSLQTWRQIAAVVPVNDFRTQRVERIGGYGTLPVVNQGQPYQPLASPTNEESTYAITKKGGTEDVTLEMIANDDIRAIQRIPTKLGLAAAQTLYRFVWDIFTANAATSYDGTALFHANHGNTDTNVLSQSNLSVGRRKMRKQTAYGDSSNVLSIVPKILLVPSDLEELAFQLCTSAVAIPATPAGPTDTPNIHQGLTPIVLDYWSSATGWYLGADPGMVPTLEVGFYQGRQDPELFTQADPSVGSVFNADKITYKIRHVYSGTVLDHRGLYRGNA